MRLGSGGKAVGRRDRVRRRSDDRGDTLLEVLMAMVIVGVAGLAILVGFRTSIVGSSQYRTVATGDTVLRSAAQQASSLLQQASSSAWAACTDANLTSSQFSLPQGYVASVSSVQYWSQSASGFVPNCVPNAAQLIQLSVMYDGNASTISLVVDDPYNPPAAQAGAATQLVFLSQPGTTDAGSSISPEPIVAVEDAQDNIVTTDLSPVSISITPGTGTSGAALSTTCAGNEVYGVVTFNNCSIAAQGMAYTLTASDGSLTPATSDPFNIVAPPANELVFTSAPTTSQGAISSAFIGPFQVEEEDAYGDPVAVTSDVSVNLATTSIGTTSGGSPFFSLQQGGSSSTATTTVTIPSGSASTPVFYYSDTAEGTPTITASSGSLVAATTSVGILPGAAAQLAFETPPPPTVGVHTSFSIVVAEEDAYGNVESSDSTTAVTLAASASGFACSTHPSHVTDGVATFSGCSFSTAAPSDTLTASSGSLSPAVAQVAVTPAAAAKLVFTGPPPASIPAGASFGVTVSEEDSYGNVETGDSSTALTLGASGGGFTCTTAPTTVTQGVASYTGCSFTTASASAYTLTASAGSLTSATAKVTVIGAPAKLVYTTAPPSSVITGSTFNVVVSEEDAFGNVEATDSASPVTLAANNGGGGFTCTVAPATFTDGVASFSGCSFSIPAGSPYVLSATSGTLTPATAQVSAVGPPAMLAYATKPPAAVAAGTTFSVIVDEEDALGNVEVGDSTTAVSLSSGGGFYCTTAPSHFTAGVATYTGCSFATASVSPYTVTAASGTLTPAVATTTVSPGVAKKWVFTTPPPGSATAGSVFSVVVADEDGNGNLEASDNSSAVALSAGGGFTCGSSPSHVTAGTATFTGCTMTVANVVAYTMTASGSGLSQATAQVTVTPSTATKLVYLAGPPSTLRAGSQITITVAEEDTYGNVETGDSSTALTLAANNGGGGLSCSGHPSHITAGEASYTGCIFTVASSSPYTLSATSGSLTPAASPVTVTPGNATKLVYTTGPPGSTTAGATFGVVVAEEDAYGNVESGDSTTALTLSANNGGGGLSCTSTPTQLSAGTATYAGCSFRLAGGSPYTLTAASSGLTSATAQVVVVHAAASQIAFTTAAQTFEKGTTGSTGSGTITVALEDQYGNPVPAASGGVQVALTTSTTTGSFTPSATLSIASGTSSSSFTYHDSASGTPTLTATASGLGTATQTETVLGTASANVVVTVGTANPSPVTAGDSTTYTVTVTNSASRQDFQITSVSGLPAGASWTTSACQTISSGGRGGRFTLTVPTAATTPNGTSTIAVVVTGYSSSSGSCSNANETQQGDGSLTVSAPASQLSFGAQPATGAHGTTLPAVTVLVEDADFDPVTAGSPQVTIAIANNPGGATLSGTLTVTAVNGVATFSTLRLSAAGTGYTLTATSAGLTSTTSAPFNQT